MLNDYKTADDEEPICGECDSQSDGYQCYRRGPEYGWIGYRRTIVEEAEELSEKEERERLMEDISGEEAKRIFDKYSSMYDEALRRLS